MNARSQFNPRGRFRVEHLRDGQLLNVYEFPNGITDEGKDDALGVLFDTGTQKTTWHLGLIDATTPTLADDDTYDDIDQAGNGWDEFQDYTDAGNADSAVTRPVWSHDGASGQSVTNSAFVIFDVTGAGDVHGLFVVAGPEADTKGDHTSGNILWATAAFTGGDVPVLNGDQLRATYTVSA